MDSLSNPESNAEVLGAIEGAELTVNDPVVLEAMLSRATAGEERAEEHIRRMRSQGKSADRTLRQQENQEATTPEPANAEATATPPEVPVTPSTEPQVVAPVAPAAIEVVPVPAPTAPAPTEVPAAVQPPQPMSATSSAEVIARLAMVERQQLLDAAEKAGKRSGKKEAKRQQKKQQRSAAPSSAAAPTAPATPAASPIVPTAPAAAPAPPTAPTPPGATPPAPPAPGAPATPTPPAATEQVPATIERADAHRVALALFNEIGRGSGQRREREFGGLLGRASRWLSSSFERCAESQDIAQAGAILRDNPRVGKWFGIGLKTLGGGAAIAGTLLSGGGLLAAGGVAKFLMPIMYSAGLKVGLSGVLHGAQEFVWGRGRAKEQLAAQNNVTTTMDNLRRLIVDGQGEVSGPEFTRMTQELWAAHSKLSERELSNFDARQKEQAFRNLASTAGALSIAFLGGVPAGIVDIDKAATLSDAGKTAATAAGVKLAPTVLNVQEHAVIVKPIFANLFSGGALMKGEFLYNAASGEYETAATAAKLAGLTPDTFGTFMGLKSHALNLGSEGYNVLTKSLFSILGAAGLSTLIGGSKRSIEEKARQRIDVEVPRRFKLPPEQLAPAEQVPTPPQNPTAAPTPRATVRTVTPAQPVVIAPTASAPTPTPSRPRTPATAPVPAAPQGGIFGLFDRAGASIRRFLARIGLIENP